MVLFRFGEANRIGDACYLPFPENIVCYLTVPKRRRAGKAPWQALGRVRGRGSEGTAWPGGFPVVSTRKAKLGRVRRRRVGV